MSLGAVSAQGRDPPGKIQVDRVSWSEQKHDLPFHAKMSDPQTSVISYQSAFRRHTCVARATGARDGTCHASSAAVVSCTHAWEPRRLPRFAERCTECISHF
mmetsp:Transcript_26371/g.66384  ORF Transcript_26371/g.66384 Transcript_26371/m.66384 type:complete len:102 (-) Transcript_26371:7-312(-)